MCLLASVDHKLNKYGYIQRPNSNVHGLELLSLFGEHFCEPNHFFFFFFEKKKKIKNKKKKQERKKKEWNY